MKFTTMIPKQFNDGESVPQTLLRDILSRFWVAFGGLTVEGEVEGYWMNEEETLFVDPCLKVFSVCDDDQYKEAVELVMQIGRELEQEAMYFEVQYHPTKSGVEILDTK